MSNAIDQNTAMYALSEKRYTNVNVLLGIGVGLLLTLVFFGLIHFLADTLPSVYALFWERGPIQYISSFLFFFGLALLFFKNLKIGKERDAFNLDFVQSLTQGQQAKGADTFISAMHEIDEEHQDDGRMLVNRINKALKQMKINPSPADVADVMTKSSEIDASIVDTSYILIKFMVWIIPIAGFIGTIIGMSSSIGAFDSVLSGIGETGFSSVGQNLGQVTGGLSTAFDTTFIALVLSAILNFLVNVTQRKEESLMSDIEEFVINHIINKFSMIRENLKGRLDEEGNHHQEVIAKMEEIKGEVSGLGVSFEKINSDGINQLVDELKNLNKAQQYTSQDVVDKLEKLIQNLSKLDLGKGIGEHFQSIAQLLETYKGNLTEIGDLLEKANQINNRLIAMYGKIYKLDE